MRKKKLVTLGNSVGLIIDQGFLRMMGLRRGSIVRLECDGRTLIMRPTGEHECDEPRDKRRDSRRAVRHGEDTGGGAPIDCEAARKAGMSTAEFAALTARAPAVFEGLMTSSLPLESFRAVYHGPVDAPPPSLGPAMGWSMTLHRFSWWLDSEAIFDPTDAQLATMRRLEALYSARKRFGSWAECVQHALREVPMVSDPDDTIMREEPARRNTNEGDDTVSEARKPGAIMAMLEAAEAEEEWVRYQTRTSPWPDDD